MTSTEYQQLVGGSRTSIDRSVWSQILERDLAELKERVGVLQGRINDLERRLGPEPGWVSAYST